MIARIIYLLRNKGGLRSNGYCLNYDSWDYNDGQDYFYLLRNKGGLRNIAYYAGEYGML